MESAAYNRQQSCVKCATTEAGPSGARYICFSQINSAFREVKNICFFAVFYFSAV